MPDAFRLAIRYRNQLDAYSSSFYPGAWLADDVTVEFETKDWFEILRLLQFVR
jgi:D-amino peptidase